MGLNLDRRFSPSLNDVTIGIIHTLWTSMKQGSHGSFNIALNSCHI